MLKKLSLLFGVVFILVGVLGFVPGVTRDGHLLGIFHVNLAHNVVHVLTGLVAVVMGLTSDHAARIFFCVFGVIYGLVAILGFAYGDQPILGILASNTADTWLHVGIAAVSLVLGFAVKETAEVKVQERTA